MLAFLTIPLEALRQWRTNTLARRYLRRAMLWGLAAAVLIVVIRQVCVGLVNAVLANSGATLQGPLGKCLLYLNAAIADPNIYAAAAVAAWHYRRTFLESVEFRSLPLTPQERLGAILLPTTIYIVVSMFGGQAIGIAYYYLWTDSNAPHSPFAVASSFVRSYFWLVLFTFYYATISLLYLIARPRGPVKLTVAMAFPILALLCLTLLSSALAVFLRKRDTLFSHPSGSPSFYQIASILATLCTVGIGIPLMAALLGQSMRRAEAELFTPEAVERWEAHRK